MNFHNFLIHFPPKKLQFFFFCEIMLTDFIIDLALSESPSEFFFILNGNHQQRLLIIFLASQYVSDMKQPKL